MGGDMDPFDRDEQFHALVAMMRRVRPLALVGAGASIGSGYPTWSQLLTQLGEELRAQGPRSVAPKLGAVVKDLQDPAWQAEEYYNALGASAFHAFLRKSFARRPVAEPHYLIARLGFRHILTTNFDSCAEEAFRTVNPGRKFRRIIWSKDDEIQDFFTDLTDAEAETSIVYLHGHESDPASIVLKESDYSHTYLREENRRRMIALFMTQPMVFIGFSMNDPDLGQIMREVIFSLPRRPGADAKEVGRKSPARHFALFGYRTAPERDLIRRRMEGKFGLQTVFYRILPTADGTAYLHDNLLGLLEAIGAAAPPKSGLTSSPANTPATGAGAVSQGIARVLTPGASLVVPGDSDRLVSAAGLTDVEEIFDLDPNKGAFGNAPSRDGYELRVTRIKERSAWVEFVLEVRAVEGAAFKGEVTFYYHPTFTPQVETIEIGRGRARTTLKAVGAFTVGAEYGSTRLELDLSDDGRFPTWFREN